MGNSKTQLESNASSLGTPYVEETKLEAPKHVIARFQKIAQASCECTRTSGDENACWEEFNAATNNPDNMFATACGIGSISGVCFETDDGEVCVTTKFGVTGVCSAKESLAVQAAHSAAYSNFMTENGANDAQTLRPQAYSAANQAVDEVVAKLRRGELVEPSGEGGGCAG